MPGEIQQQTTTAAARVRFQTDASAGVRAALRSVADMGADKLNTDHEVGAVVDATARLTAAEQDELRGALDGFARATGDAGLAGFLKATRGPVFQAVLAKEKCDGELTTKESMTIGADVLADGVVDPGERMSVAAALLAAKMGQGARANLKALLDDPRVDVPPREIATILLREFDRLAEGRALLMPVDLARAAADACLPQEIRDACASALEQKDAYAEMETRHYLSLPDGAASKADLDLYLNPLRADLSLVDCARALQAHFAARGVDKITQGELLGLRGDLSAERAARDAAATLLANPALFIQAETAAFGGPGDEILGAADIDAILNPKPKFPQYGADWPWPGEGIRKYRFQPDADGWIHDHFISGRGDHGLVYYNVTTKQLECRELGHGRDMPLMADAAKAQRLIAHARNTIFNDRKLYVVG